MRLVKVWLITSLDHKKNIFRVFHLFSSFLLLSLITHKRNEKSFFFFLFCFLDKENWKARRGESNREKNNHKRSDKKNGIFNLFYTTLSWTKESESPFNQWSFWYLHVYVAKIGIKFTLFADFFYFQRGFSNFVNSSPLTGNRE